MNEWGRSNNPGKLPRPRKIEGTERCDVFAKCFRVVQKQS
jgi:hypothetical protein